MKSVDAAGCDMRCGDELEEPGMSAGTCVLTPAGFLDLAVGADLPKKARPFVTSLPSIQEEEEVIVMNLTGHLLPPSSEHFVELIAEAIEAPNCSMCQRYGWK